jgi:general secretion pathway protein G
MYKIIHKRILPLRYRFRVLLKWISEERKGCYGGFTLIELLVVIGIIGTLSSIAIPTYSGYIERAKNTKAAAEIRILEKEIIACEAENEYLPDTLNDIDRGNLRDPWGNPYQYLNFENVQGKGKMRKDRFLVPLNSDFDLYSKGKDGASQLPLTAKDSRDDIIRASNGQYVGIASEY